MLLSYTDWVRQRGKLISKEEHTAARLHAAALPELLAQYWQVDAILSPMLAYDPPRRGTFLSLDHQESFDEQTRWSPWGSLFNVAKLPAVSIPCRYTITHRLASSWEASRLTTPSFSA